MLPVLDYDLRLQYCRGINHRT